MAHTDQIYLGLTLKRSFDDTVSPVPVPKQRKLLPLFVWNNNSNSNSNSNNNKKEMEEGNSSTSVVVGWPPVKSWKKKKSNTNYRQYDQEYQQDGCVINVEDDGDDSRRKMFVKVSMEGMPIGRKIDLSFYHSYQSLTTAILIMFGKYHGYRNVKVEGDNRGDSYTLTYLDREGDWLLVGDVPWRTFIESVQRLKIIKKNSSF